VRAHGMKVSRGGLRRSERPAGGRRPSRIEHQTVTAGTSCGRSCKVWSLTVDDKEYERLRSEYSVASMVDTPDGLEIRLLSDVPRDDRWKAVTPTLEDAYLWLIGNGDGHE
jgi:hypothetical protein